MHCRLWVKVACEFGRERSSRIQDVLPTDIRCREPWAEPQVPQVLTLACLLAPPLLNGAAVAQAADSQGS